MAKKIYVSNVPRARDTGLIVQSTMKKLWQDISLSIRDIFSYTNPKYYSEAYSQEFLDWKATGISEDAFVTNFLDGKRKIKPIELAKPYLQELMRAFSRIVASNKTLSIIAFRHGDKDAEGWLSDLWKQQAEILWKKLVLEDVKTDDVIYIATHNSINEALVRSIIPEANLPVEWKSPPLQFTEDIRYILSPSLNGEPASLEIQWRWKSCQISYEYLCDFMQSQK
jgi:hypothetical protein